MTAWLFWGTKAQNIVPKFIKSKVKLELVGKELNIFDKFIMFCFFESREINLFGKYFLVNFLIYINKILIK